MSDVNALFIAASVGKYRFAGSPGLLTAEDLWDLPLTSAKRPNLDDIARGLHRELKEVDGDVSFVTPAVKKSTELQAKLEIVKYVISVKVAERDARSAAEDKAAMKQKLLAKLSEKKDKALDELSEEQIQAMINSL